MLLEGHIETTSFKEIFVALEPFGLDTAAEAMQRDSGLRRPVAYSTNGLPLKQTVR
jgi:hypothetical protein